MADELNYQVPPDILHYESKYFLGFGMSEVMAGLIVGMLFMLGNSPVTGLIAGAFTLVAMRRYDGLGNRSVVMYLGAWIWYRWRPQNVIMPRTLPPGAARLEITSWDGDPMFVIDRSA